MNATLLYRAVHFFDVESVRFLLLQDGILINKVSRSVTQRQGAADSIRWRTPLYLAEQRVTSAGRWDGGYRTRTNQVAELLRDAGGQHA